MANQWLRLWHDMPNDPKWRTIARASGQHITVVMSIYIHLLVTASQNVTRGHADVTNEDLASALDLDVDQVDAVLHAMQNRVLDGMQIKGWEKRQPKKEDAGSPESRAKSSAERKRDQRERERLAAESKPVTASHEMSRDVTTDKDKEEDKEEDKDLKAKEKKEKRAALSLAFRGKASEILDYLNFKTDRAFEPVETTLKPIISTLALGATSEDCKQVIDYKVREWGRDEKMHKYLRPETLFSGKFGSYLQEAKNPPKLLAPQPGLALVARASSGKAPDQLAADNEEARRLLFGNKSPEVIDV